MAGFAAGSAIIYANSEPFREKVSGMIAQSSGAQVQLEQFRVTPTRANAGKLALTWPDDKVLKELTVRGVSASIVPSSFLGKSLAGDEVAATDGTLRLGFPLPGESAAADVAASPLPIRFRHYTAPKLAISLGDATKPALLLRDTEVSFEPSNANSRPQVLLNRGTVTARPWPAILMDRAHIEIREGVIDIVGMRLLHPEDSRGQIDLTGTVDPRAADRPSSLDVRMESFLLSGILGQDLGTLVSGRVDTVSDPSSNHLTLTPGSAADTRLVVSFSKSIAAPIELRNFKFLADLVRLLEDNWFERPLFEMDATGAIRRSGGEVVLENLDFEHKGRMALRGGLTADASGRLSGRLRLGISEAMLLATENSRLISMFESSDDAFRWLDLEIGGSAKSPTDDFMKLYDATPAAPDSAPGRGVPTFEELIAPE
ncbi:MAG TPA: hypothetical protein VLO11_12655, partial [Luteolibacter sp.]|nr:hypothetical protein [Luteolibacter sp.]